MSKSLFKLYSLLSRWDKILIITGAFFLIMVYTGLNLTINYSESIPKGLYYVRNSTASKGEITIVYSNEILQFAKHRNYIVAGTLIGKRIVAISGDTVCIKKSGVYVNGNHISNSKPLLFDSGGREMPKIRGCVVLHGQQAFVMGNKKRSLDSRYFGPITAYRKELVPLLTARGFFGL